MRVGDYVWIASRANDFNAEIAEYSKPKKIKTRFNYLTVMPASSRGGLEFMKHGETVYDTWTVIANARYFGGKIKEGDLMWVDGDEPIEQVENAYGYGASATAMVDSALPVNFTLNIILKRNQAQVKK